MVPSSKTTHRFPNRRQLQEGATLRDEARASCRASRCAATHAISPRFRPCGIGPAGRSPAKRREAIDLGGGVRKGEKGSLRYGVIDNDRQIPLHRQRSGPTIDQLYSATNKNKRYQMSSNVPLIIIFFRLFRGGRTAHNGLAGLLKWRRYPVSGTTLSVSTNPIVPNAARTVGQQRRDRESEPHHDENQTAPRPRRPTRSRPVRG